MKTKTAVNLMLLLAACTVRAVLANIFGYKLYTPDSIFYGAILVAVYHFGMYRGRNQ